MDILELGAIGELVGGIAVIASLIFVGLQIRQNTRTTRSSAQLDSARFWSEQNIRAALSSDIARIVEVGLTDESSLTEDEQRRLMFWISHHFFMVEALFHQWRSGELPEHSWLPHKHTIAGLVVTPAGQTWWRLVGGNGLLSAPFVDYVTGLAESGGRAWKMFRIADALGSSREDS